MTRKSLLHKCMLALLILVGNASATTVIDDTVTKQAEKAPNPRLLMRTSLGDMTIELYPEAAPKTVANFAAYAKAGFYDNTIFHRVVPGFVVQGGGFDLQYRRKPTFDPIVNESSPSLKNLRGTLSMARLPSPDSATSQFFINLTDNPSLDWKPSQPGYAVFGKVIQGIEVIDKMATLPQGDHNGVFDNAPNEPVVILSVIPVEPTAKP